MTKWSDGGSGPWVGWEVLGKVSEGSLEGCTMVVYVFWSKAQKMFMVIDLSIPKCRLPD